MQFTQGDDCLEFTNAFEIPARDAVPMEVMSVLILQNQLCIGSMCFPALGTDYMYLLCFLICVLCRLCVL